MTLIFSFIYKSTLGEEEGDEWKRPKVGERAREILSGVGERVCQNLVGVYSTSGLSWGSARGMLWRRDDKNYG